MDRYVEVEGLYDVKVTLTRPKGGLPRTKGVARDKREELHRIRAFNTSDAVNQAATLAWCYHGPKGWDVTASFTYAGITTRRRYVHKMEA